MIKFEVKSRWSGAVKFTAEIDCDENASHSVKLGLAVKWGLKNDTDLRDTDLSGAVLSGAVLRDTDLRGADLRDTDLSGAVLSGAVLRDTDLRGAKFGNGTTSNITPLQIIGLTWDVIIFDNTMKIGCQWHSLHDWELFDDDTIKRMDVRNAPQFWATNKDWLLGFAKAHGRTFEPVEKA